MNHLDHRDRSDLGAVELVIPVEFVLQATTSSVIPQIVPGAPPYEHLFGENSKQFKAVDSCNGKLGDVLLDEQAYIVIRIQPSAFGPDNPDVLNCVRLKKEKGKWLYEKF